MSRLDELIAKFCPNGVKYRELKDILIIKNGKDYKNLTEGKYPVYGSGGIMTYVSSYVYDKPSVFQEKDLLINYIMWKNHFGMWIQYFIQKLMKKK